MLDGRLFATEFLTDTVRTLPDWARVEVDAFETLKSRLLDIIGAFPAEKGPNEAQTEDKLVYPIMEALGWSNKLVQENLSAKGRKNVPDALFLLSDDAEAKANAEKHQADSYQHGTLLLEAKRWERKLDRGSKDVGDRQAGSAGAPSNQMLGYLNRAETVSNRKVRYGVLTNGRIWRLYTTTTRVPSEEYLEVDLMQALGLVEPDDDIKFVESAPTPDHALKVFALMFGRDGFLDEGEGILHTRAVEESRLYEAKVAKDLSDKIFEEVFPRLGKAIAAEAPEADLDTVRDAALVVLYRMLFILYAEDRALLPVGLPNYDKISLRFLREEVARLVSEAREVSGSMSLYWMRFRQLCRAIDKGDPSLGLPPYNGGLFNPDNHPLLEDVELTDDVMAKLLFAMGFEVGKSRPSYINYRDLSVQQLGSVYEKLLEYELAREDGEIVVRPSVFARKGSGSYYTPQDLVDLIIKETVGPLIEEAKAAPGDTAEAILALKVCDPAMGSAHFLVSLVDYLAERVRDALGEAEDSPVQDRIEAIRMTITANAERGGWRIREGQMEDPQIIRRMVLKRCVYGVDKNPMAVELAKVSLWLHTFTVGAPLSFLDHHLQCGDSLFGMWVLDFKFEIANIGGGMFVSELVKEAIQADSISQILSLIPDIEIAEVEQSRRHHQRIDELTKPLISYMSFVTAIKWLCLSSSDRDALKRFFDGDFGEVKPILLGYRDVRTPDPEGERIAEIINSARKLISEENFFHWEVEFPTVWTDWGQKHRTGGFDAVIGNPPWDRIKLQQVEWFAERRPAIARLPRAADRRKAIAKLERDGDPLADDYARAAERAKQRLRVARAKKRKGKYVGDYPLLGRGDINLYSLFVERATQIIDRDGYVGLLVPSGIASDKTASDFFRSVATSGRLRALYDFENKKIFFPDVHASFKFSVFVVSGLPSDEDAAVAFYLHSVDGIEDPDRAFTLSAEDFALINPNTGTAPIFRSRRDAELTRGIYERLPVLVDHSGKGEVKAWPVKYLRMFDMTNDSGLFRTEAELREQEKAWPLGGNRWESADGEWVPLYEGKMVQAYNHRAASIQRNEANLNRPAQPVPADQEDLADPAWTPKAQYYVPKSEVEHGATTYALGFKEITATTNQRTMIAAAFPLFGFGNKVPVLDAQERTDLALLLANMNSVPFDFVARQKVQGQTINLYILEQLPVVPPSGYDRAFGPKTAREIVREAVLELTYTADDMAPFARDMDYVDESGEVREPFVWDERRRLMLRAKLDAVYFHLYGITEPEDVRYIYSTFPIVEGHERRDYGDYRSMELCLHWMNALDGGQPDAEIPFDA